MGFPAAGLQAGELAIRLPCEADVDRLVELCADPEIARWTLLPSPYTKEDALKWVSLSRTRAQSDDAFHLVVIDPSGLVGSVGLEVRASHAGPIGNAGYWTAKTARGRDVAPTALAALTRWAMSELQIAAVEVVIDPANEASRRVAVKAGFLREGRSSELFRGNRVLFDRYVLRPLA